MKTAVDDALWSAIGDPTRRQIVELLLADAGRTATLLSARLPITRQAVAKHLAVLERVGLVSSETCGRERAYDLDQERLERAAEQLSSVGQVWARRLQRITAIAEAIEKAEQN